MPDRIPMVDEMTEEEEDAMEEEDGMKTPIYNGWIIQPPLAQPESLSVSLLTLHGGQHSVDTEETDIEDEEDEDKDKDDFKEDEEIKTMATPTRRQGGIMLLFRHLPFCSEVPVLH